MSIDTDRPAEARVFYRSRVDVEPRSGRVKLVSLPRGPEPVAMGFHDELATQAGLVDGTFPPMTSTLDYLVGATAGCMTGVLSAALVARGIPVDGGRLRVEAVGEVETDDGVPVLRRIHLVAHLRAEESQRAAARRVAASFEQRCPIYRSLRAAIDITTELDFQPTVTP